MEIKKIDNKILGDGTNHFVGKGLGHGRGYWDGSCYGNGGSSGDGDGDGDGTGSGGGRTKWSVRLISEYEVSK